MRERWLIVLGAVVLTLVLAVGAFAANPIRLLLNGQEIEPDVPAQIVNGRAMVPIRWVAEALGADVEQDASNKAACAVKITTKTQSQDILQRLRALEPEDPTTEPQIVLLRVITPDGHELERTVDISMTPFPGMLFSPLFGVFICFQSV
ncbi:MAG TPA: copper amine oxidase N-terminal domain-containing protein [Bacillota bacterium]|nr:copper amine oxidase N-terminal domain-containing protein [Bacillota bacterium]HQD73564.1 copper amine oxidase N-terminal domain-containing protein [Bacillota bacterium]